VYLSPFADKTFKVFHLGPNQNLNLRPPATPERSECGQAEMTPQNEIRIS
jgi:hypothetical protein